MFLIILLNWIVFNLSIFISFISKSSGKIISLSISFGLLLMNFFLLIGYVALKLELIAFLPSSSGSSKPSYESSTFLIINDNKIADINTLKYNYLYFFYYKREYFYSRNPNYNWLKRAYTISYISKFSLEILVILLS